MLPLSYLARATAITDRIQHVIQIDVEPLQFFVTLLVFQNDRKGLAQLFSFV